jgi:hypothetical protein
LVVKSSTDWIRQPIDLVSFLHMIPLIYVHIYHKYIYFFNAINNRRDLHIYAILMISVEENNLIKILRIKWG